MPRPTDQGLLGTHAGAGFTPGNPSNITTQVVAPLDVAGAPSQAAALAKSLGLFNDDVQRAEGEEARLKGAQDNDLGEAWARLHPGQTPTAEDMKRASRAEGFATGVLRVNTMNKAQAAVNNARSWAAQNMDLPLYDTTDANGNTVPGFASGIQAHYNAAFPNGEEKDPEAAKIMYNTLQHNFNEMLAEKYTHDIANTQDQARTAAQGAIRDHVVNKTPINESELFETLKHANLGDNAKAREDFLHSVLQVGIEQGNPDVINELAPKDKAFGGGATWTAVQRAQIDEGLTHAQEVKDKNLAFQQGQDHADFVKPLEDDLANGKTLSWGHLVYGYTHGLDPEHGKTIITPDEALSLWRRSLSNAYAGVGDDVALKIVMSGEPWYTYVDRNVGFDKNGNPKRLEKADFEHAATDWIDQLPPEQRPRAAIELTHRQGLVYGPLVATMSNMPVNTPQGVKTVLDTYQTLRNYDQTASAKYFSDPASRERADYMLGLRENGWNDQQIADQMTKYDPKEARDNYQHFIFPKVQEKLDNFKIDGSHWLAGDFRGVRLNQLVNSGEVVSRVARNANTIGQQGLVADPDEIVKRAEQQVLDSSYLIRLPDNHSILMPMAATDPPKEQVEPAMQDFYATKLPDIIKKSNFKGDPSEVKLVPSPYQDGVLQLVDVTGHPVNADRYTVRGITQAYDLATHADRADKVRKAQDDAQRTTEQITKMNAEVEASVASQHVRGFRFPIATK